MAFLMVTYFKRALDYTKERFARDEGLGRSDRGISYSGHHEGFSDLRDNAIISINSRYSRLWQSLPLLDPKHV